MKIFVMVIVLLNTPTTGEVDLKLTKYEFPNMKSCVNFLNMIKIEGKPYLDCIEMQK